MRISSVLLISASIAFASVEADVLERLLRAKTEIQEIPVETTQPAIEQVEDVLIPEIELKPIEHVDVPYTEEVMTPE